MVWVMLCMVLIDEKVINFIGIRIFSRRRLISYFYDILLRVAVGGCVAYR